MGRYVLLLSAASAGLAGCVSSDRAGLVEQGYERGALGVAAIARSDWAGAEQALTERKAVRGDDPARLINLGRVYMETGREEEAVAAWKAALASERHFVAETADGKAMRTDQLARRALARYEERDAPR